MATLSVSEPSVSVRAGLIVSGMAVSSLPVAAVTLNVGVSDTGFTVTCSASVLVAATADPSFAVAVTVRVKSTSLFSGGVIFNPASCSGVRVMEPPVTVSTPFRSLARVAPVGMPAMVTVSTSVPSVSVRAGLIVSGIAVSSLPATAWTVSVGVSDTGLTVTDSVSLTETGAATPSLAVAVTVRSKSTSLFSGGVIFSPANWAGVRVIDPLPMTSASPAVLLRLAPAGMPLMVIDSVSDPSKSVRAGSMVSGMPVSSLPAAAPTVSVGVSVTGLTVTSSGALVLAGSAPPSRAVAVTVRVKSTSLFRGGVIFRPASWPGASVMVPLLIVSVSPAVLRRLAPTGMPLMVTLSDSEPSVSVRAGSMTSGMPVSSFPTAAATLSVGVSDTGLTVTRRGALVLTGVAVPSVAVAVTVRVKSASLLFGGVIDSPASCAGVRVAVPFTTASAPPALRSTAPSGMPDRVMVSVSEPSVSVRAGLIVSGIAVSSLPLAAETARVGMSETGLTVTSSGALVLAGAALPSVLVAVTVRVKSASLFSGGVIANPASWPGASVMEPLAIVSVSPAALVRTAPAGMPLMVTLSVSDPSVSVRAGVMVSGIAVSSAPVVAATLRVGVSDTGLTVTGRVVVTLVGAAVPSVLVAVTVRVKLSPLFGGGVRVRPGTCEEVSRMVPFTTVRMVPEASRRTAPSGMPDRVTVSTSVPPVSVRAASMFRAMAVSSSPDTPFTVRLGVSDTGAGGAAASPVVSAASCSAAGATMSGRTPLSITWSGVSGAGMSDRAAGSSVKAVVVRALDSRSTRSTVAATGSRRSSVESPDPSGPDGPEPSVPSVRSTSPASSAATCA